MNWVNKWKLLAIEAIKYNNQPCLEINDLWHALHSSFNIALHHSIENVILNEIDLISPFSWTLFLEEEFTNVLAKCNNSSTPGLDELSWSYLKHVLKDNVWLNNIIRIANVCLDLGYWPSHFKISTTIVIPNPTNLCMICLSPLDQLFCLTLWAN